MHSNGKHPPRPDYGRFDRDDYRFPTGCLIAVIGGALLWIAFYVILWSFLPIPP